MRSRRRVGILCRLHFTAPGSDNNRLEVAQYLVNKRQHLRHRWRKQQEIPLQWAVRNFKCLKMLELLLGAEDEDEHAVVAYGMLKLKRRLLRF